MTASNPVVMYHTEGNVARVTLNRPDALNAFDSALRMQLTAALQRAAADVAVRAVVLTGAGRAFSAGADLKSGMASGEEVHRQLLREYAPAINAIAQMPKPVIAAVEGFVAGIGCAYVLTSDLVVMGECAFFMLPFSNIALVPDGGLCWLLERRLGHRMAFELAAESERIGAPRCRDLGLVNRVVADGTAVEKAHAWARRLAARPPLALAYTKQLLHEAATHSLKQMQEKEASLQSKCIDSTDFREGVSAFLEKRTARFVGS